MNHPETARGIALSVIASTLFALLSAYTGWLAPLNGLDIFAWRIVWTLPPALVLIVWRRHGAQLRDAVLALLRAPLQALLFVAMTAMLGVQLWLFLWAPLNGRALDVSLGYFLLPLAMVLIGRFYYGERLDVWQRIAVACAIAGVLHELWMTRAFSWPTVLVALGYPPYFMLRRRLKLNSLVIFTIEIALLTPVAVYTLAISPNLPTVWQRPDMYLMLLPGLGLLSTAALDCFLRASRLLPMGLFGILGYVEPVLLVVVALILLDETLTSAQLWTYVPIWMSVGFTAIHSVRLMRRR
ncbi:rarD protein [Herbaspirillum sp. CF444]|uniref:EamA family transporter RarD n=1 Tax=Herbaspirillum sp. CF444 TaxID=1144319 RepID=UPI00027262F9|nr:EamA family transporter RarD [Herbaspirillum sp. CF444]EJL92807.1 rarD protein [Herbaspirillum sp. CF444]